MSCPLAGLSDTLPIFDLEKDILIPDRGHWRSFYGPLHQSEWIPSYKSAKSSDLRMVVYHNENDDCTRKDVVQALFYDFSAPIYVDADHTIGNLSNRGYIKFELRAKLHKYAQPYKAVSRKHGVPEIVFSFPDDLSANLAIGTERSYGQLHQEKMQQMIQSRILFFTGVRDEFSILSKAMDLHNFIKSDLDDKHRILGEGFNRSLDASARLNKRSNYILVKDHPSNQD